METRSAEQRVEGLDCAADEGAACGLNLLRAFACEASYGFFCKKGIDLDQSLATHPRARQEKDRPGVAALEADNGTRTLSYARLCEDSRWISYVPSIDIISTPGGGGCARYRADDGIHCSR